MKINHNLLTFVVAFISSPSLAIAENVAPISPTGGVLKMIIGLVVVLAVMALITWLLKRMVPGVGNKQSVIKIVGGVSVGSRERVVVLEVSGRWIVVGVAAGQVSRLANLESGSMKISESIPTGRSMLESDAEGFTNTFATWLTKSTGKILDKKDLEK
jgi:flagellar protein FliO/FliZ